MVHVQFLSWSGVTRRYLIHAPAGWDGHTRLPVVVMLHGAGGTASWTLKETKWAAHADTHRFWLVLPDGMPVDPSRPPKFLSNPQVWNDGGMGGLAARARHDDVGFLGAVLDDIERRHGLDPRRIYATGFSNGAAMTFRLATELSPRLAAIAPVAGHCKIEHPHPARPVPTLFMIGDSDPLVPFLGGQVVSPWTKEVGVRPPIEGSLERWAKAINCQPTAQVVEDQDGVRVYRYPPNEGGAEMVVYTIAGLGHHWPGGLGRLKKSIAGEPSGKVQANEIIWEFFKRFELS